MPTEKLEPHIPILATESAPWSVASLKRLFTEYQMSNVSFVDNAYKTIHKGRFEKYSLILISDILEKGESSNSTRPRSFSRKRLNSNPILSRLSWRCRKCPPGKTATAKIANNPHSGASLQCQKMMIVDSIRDLRFPS